MDWKALIADLVATGLTQIELAAQCGVAQSTISDLHRGASKQPNYELGSALVRLHKERVTPATQEASDAA
jgi:transcriptional regulator with XRE-family HTH domain